MRLAIPALAEAVGDNDIGSDPLEDGADRRRRVRKGCAGPGAGVASGGAADHPRVTVGRGPALGAEAQHVTGRTEQGQGGPQLAEPVGRERVARCAFEVAQRLGDHLTLLAERAGEDMDVIAPSDMVSDRDPRPQRLVVGVGMDEQQAGRPCVRDEPRPRPHPATAMSANSTTPPRISLAEKFRMSEPATYMARRSASPM